MSARRAVVRVAISLASALIMAGIFAGTGNAGAITARSGAGWLIMVDITASEDSYGTAPVSR